MATSRTQDCYIALELSRSKWLIGALLPGGSKITTTLVPADAMDHLRPQVRMGRYYTPQPAGCTT